MTRTLLKAESAQIQIEIKPLENEMERLKIIQEELQEQIMSSRIIEKQLSMKTEEIFQSNIFKNKENTYENTNFKENSYENTNYQENSYEKPNSPIKSSPFKEKTLLNESDFKATKSIKREITDVDSKVFKKGSILLKKKPLEERPLYEDLPLKGMNDFEKKWKLFEEIDKDMDKSPTKQEENFNKENIDKLSEEIQELLNMHERKTERNNIIWGNLSEIKEASIEESLI